MSAAISAAPPQVPAGGKECTSAPCSSGNGALSMASARTSTATVARASGSKSITRMCGHGGRAGQGAHEVPASHSPALPGLAVASTSLRAASTSHGRPSVTRGNDRHREVARRDRRRCDVGAHRIAPIPAVQLQVSLSRRRRESARRRATKLQGP